MTKAFVMQFQTFIAAIALIAGLASPTAAAPAPQGEALVVSHIETGMLVPGRHHFYLKVAARASGQPYLVPVIVIKGRKEGTRLGLFAAIHGDELAGIRVIHKLADEIDPEKLQGTLLMVPGLNQSGLEAGNRHFISGSGSGFRTDLNRTMPGELRGDVAERYAADLWRGVMEGKVDQVIDLHTQTRGTAYPLFVFADFANAGARQMALDLMPDMIKNDPGEPGTVETTFMRAGTPAVTYEIGVPERFDPAMIARAHDGILNVMRRAGMIEGRVVTAKKAPIIGASYSNVMTEQGGFAVIHVKLMEAVKRGQLVATLYDPFGREIATYIAPHDGHVLSLATDPRREPGAMLVRILR